MKQQDTRQAAKHRLKIIAVLTLTMVLLWVLAGYPWLIERYYSTGFYVVICNVFHFVFNVMPFSAGDVLYISLVLYLVYQFGLLIRLALVKNYQQAGNLILNLIIIAQSLIVCFYLFWGLNYFRPSAAERLKLQPYRYTTAQLVAVTSLLIDSANQTRSRVTARDLAQANSEIYSRAIKAVNQLALTSANFKTYQPKIKSALLTPLLNYLGTSGYYNPFTSEAQMNYQMPVFDRPAVACHELSHQMGYGPEDEANFVGFTAAIRSTDRLLRYSGYKLAVEEFMYAVRMQDSVAQKQLKPRISPEVIKDFKTERLYWLSFRSKAGLLSSIFYNSFLKANNQPQGLLTYNRMVLLVMAQYKILAEARPIKAPLHQP